MDRAIPSYVPSKDGRIKISYSKGKQPKLSAFLLKRVLVLVELVLYKVIMQENPRSPQWRAGWQIENTLSWHWTRLSPSHQIFDTGEWNGSGWSCSNLQVARIFPMWSIYWWVNMSLDFNHYLNTCCDVSSPTVVCNTKHFISWFKLSLTFIADCVSNE